MTSIDELKKGSHVIPMCGLNDDDCLARRVLNIAILTQLHEYNYGKYEAEERDYLIEKTLHNYIQMSQDKIKYPSGTTPKQAAVFTIDQYERNKRNIKFHYDDGGDNDVFTNVERVYETRYDCSTVQE